MRTIHQLSRSYFTLNMLALMLIISFSGFSGMAFASEGKMDLNATNTKQLQQLPGIGKGLAKRIVEYRTTNGPFKNVEELVKVKGIGKKTFAKMKERLMIGNSAPVPTSQ